MRACDAQECQPAVPGTLLCFVLHMLANHFLQVGTLQGSVFDFIVEASS
jgi:hypothetical protein